MAARLAANGSAGCMVVPAYQRVGADYTGSEWAQPVVRLFNRYRTRHNPDRRRSPRRRNIMQPLDSIHHVAVPVQDIQSAVEWYAKTFHCRVSYQDETWAML